MSRSTAPSRATVFLTLAFALLWGCDDVATPDAAEAPSEPAVEEPPAQPASELLPAAHC